MKRNIAVKQRERGCWWLLACEYVRGVIVGEIQMFYSYTKLMKRKTEREKERGRKKEEKREKERYCKRNR